MHRRERAFRAPIELAGGGHLAPQGFQLCFVRQFPVPQEVSRFLERGDRGQVFDQISAAIDEPAVGAVDLADGGFGLYKTFPAWAELRPQALVSCAPITEI